MSIESDRPLRDPATPARAWSLLLLSVVLGALSTQLGAQLPASTPAKPSAAVPAAQPTNSFASPADTQPASPRPQHHSHVTFANGLLSVSASNASLNGLIREIAHQTGMKVTGAVAEDRVFGDYGPADPQAILTALLDGTGSNILILSNASDAPLELILTPRTGAATPPSPNLAADNDNADSDDQAPPGAPAAISAPRARPAVFPGSIPQPAPSNAISPASETVVFPPIDASSAPVTATTTPSDSNAPADSSDTVKTPQQIFEQLQRLRQQNTPGPNAPQ